MNKKDFFFCYSAKLSNYLWEDGHYCITKAINPNNGKMFSLYLKSYRLQAALDKYHELHKENEN